MAICPTTKAARRRSIERRTKAEAVPHRRMAYEQKEAYSWGARLSIDIYTILISKILRPRPGRRYCLSIVGFFFTVVYDDVGSGKLPYPGYIAWLSFYLCPGVSRVSTLSFDRTLVVYFVSGLLFGNLLSNGPSQGVTRRRGCVLFWHDSIREGIRGTSWSRPSNSNVHDGWV